jgi:putative phosphoribosyl transferase
MRFRDRNDAGRRLAEALRARQLRLTGPLVLGLPRGGVPVAAQVAAALGAALDVFVARKVGAPGHEEFGIGAVAEGGTRVVDEPVLERLGVSSAQFGRLAAREEANVAALVARYRHGRPLPPVEGRDVVLVDDGLATGLTAEAALRALRGRGPAVLVLAEPVGAPTTAARLATIADHVVCAHEPEPLHAVGAWYDDFRATPDAEVLRHLPPAPGPAAPKGPTGGAAPKGPTGGPPREPVDETRRSPSGSPTGWAG